MKVKKYDEGKEDECPNDTPPSKIEENVGDRNDDNNGDNYGGKEAECLVDTSPDAMEEDVSDRKNEKNAKTYYKEKLNAYMKLPLKR